MKGSILAFFSLIFSLSGSKDFLLFKRKCWKTSIVLEDPFSIECVKDKIIFSRAEVVPRLKWKFSNFQCQISKYFNRSELHWENWKRQSNSLDLIFLVVRFLKNYWLTRQLIQQILVAKQCLWKFRTMRVFWDQSFINIILFDYFYSFYHSKESHNSWKSLEMDKTIVSQFVFSLMNLKQFLNILKLLILEVKTNMSS